MHGMPSVRIEKSVRIACGVGLLALWTAYENAAPSLRQPAPVKPPQTDSSKKPQKKPQVLPCLLPDAAAPRWPAAWEEARPGYATGWRAGIVSCGARHPTGGNSYDGEAADCDPWAWHCFLTPAAPVAMASAPRAVIWTADPAVRTVIARTGPPSTLNPTNA